MENTTCAFTLLIRQLFFIAFLTAVTLTTYSQNDSTVLKKGFYKNYKEYLSNSPSLLHDFEVIPLARSKHDSTIAAAYFKIEDSVKMPYYIWGFCDGQHIFVNPNTIYYTDKYWKLRCAGTNPYFYYSKKSFGAGTPVVSLATSLTTSLHGPFLELMFIDKNGFPKMLSVSRIKKLLKGKPDLLKAFKNESSYDMPVLKKYLILYNQTSISAPGTANQ